MAMDPSEVEFLAEKETVKIIPNFSLDKIFLIGVSEIHNIILHVSKLASEQMLIALYSYTSLVVWTNSFIKSVKPNHFLRSIALW